MISVYPLLDSYGEIISAVQWYDDSHEWHF